MKNIYNKIKTNALFKGISEDEANKMLNCFTSYEKKYSKGEIIFSEGDKIDIIGLITYGCVHIVREDYSGNRTIIAEIKAGSMFAEAFALASENEKILPVSIYAASDCEVLFFNYQKIVAACRNSCPCHVRFIENMLSVVSRKNIMLNRRLGHLSKRSTKEKLLSYLYEQAALFGQNSFCIPFNRQQLADYLCVERSAMSAVLSELRKSGKIDYTKNHFVLNDFSEF